MTTPEPVTYAELQGGPHDGMRHAIVPDTDLIWVGPLKAAWVTDAGIPPSNVVGETLHCYQWYGSVKDDGTRIYTWIEPGVTPWPGEIVR